MFEKDTDSMNSESTSNNDSVDTTKYKMKKPKRKNNVVEFVAIKNIVSHNGNPQETKDVDDKKNG